MDSYMENVRKASARFPCLDQFFLDWERFAPARLPGSQSSQYAPSRCGVLEFVRDKQPQYVDLIDSTDLQVYVNRMKSQTRCQNRLFLVEDLEESSIEILGSALMIDPVVLADQSFAYHFSENNTIPHRTLPSLTNASRSFTLRYYELRETDDRFAKNQTLNSRRTFGRLSRRIERWGDLAAYRKGSHRTEVDVVRHNVSFWCDEGLKGNDRQGWNAIIFVDPSVTSTVASRQDCYYVLDRDRNNAICRQQIQWSRPYHTGYSDLHSWQSTRSHSAPSRQSMFDDIIFYWLHAERHETNQVFDCCVNTTLFVQQIVASHWYDFLDLQFKTLSTVDLTLKAKGRSSAGKAISTAEWREELSHFNERLSLLGLLQRRLMWYKQEMTLNLERLGFTPQSPSDDPSTTRSKSLRNAGRDFQAIWDELDRHESRVDNLVGVVTDSINLSSAMRSLHQARFGMHLSIVGAIFFPITLVAAVFSMGGDYLPGSKDFWLPWVVAIPLVMILMVMIWQGYRAHL